VYKRFKNLIIEDFELIELDEPLMVSEDFSFYQKVAPGVFYFLGTKNEELGFTHLLHNDQFNFNEKVLEIGVNTYIKLINSY
jgi:metal-dependent amidase/aminoacylase/carboxypeptidase family protein